MRLWIGLIVLAIGLVGCDELKPKKPLPVAQVEGWTYAMAGVCLLGSDPDPSPSPTPPPAPGGKCPQCNGSGKVGDGNGAWTDCMECDGDGILSGPGPVSCPTNPDCDCDSCPCGPGCACPGESSEDMPKVETVKTQEITGGSVTVCGPSGCYSVPRGSQAAYRGRVYTPQRRGLLRRIFR